MTKSVFSDRYNQFLMALVRARKASGVTQTQLAFKLDRPQSYISKIERGERRVDVVEFLDIADALGQEPVTILAAISRGGKHPL